MPAAADVKLLLLAVSGRVLVIMSIIKEFYNTHN